MRCFKMPFGIFHPIWHNTRIMAAQKKINLIIYTALIAIMGISIFLPNAYAQKRLKFSNTEDVAIAFYKTGDTIPNFERWIRESEPYKITPWANRETVMTEEKARLQLAYRNFNAEKDYLIIRTMVDAKPTATQQADGSQTYTLNAKFAQAPDALYFPYDFLGERIVVMPHKIDKFLDSALTKPQYDRLIDAGKKITDATMIVRLKATESDMSRPYDIDGLKQWVLKTEIVTLEIWNKAGQLLWEYSAPWYISPNTKALNNLYSDLPIQSPYQGSVKALPSTEKK